jgi:molecular chaperone HtpG
MQIPHRLAYVLERDQELDGAVKVSIARLEPWIKHSNLPLFPEYTKHDLEHIEAVLRTAAALIRDEAWPAITPGDAAVLILGILLHDCAMHLVEDGFLSLLTPDRSEKITPGMQDKPWNVLWEEFYGEASRFDGRQLMRLFGNTEPARRPPLDVRELTLRDRLLIGEFIRRHHPRLAQEIAMFGVPTKGNHPLMFEGFSDANEHIPALSGLIARSHGENVRAFLPYLNKHFDVRQYKGVHPVFLMTVLRVADYVQVEADRAPSQVLQIKELASPVSRGEWKAHHAIKDVRHTHEDPEALFIDALPEDVQTFFRVQSWLDGIQYELDASWAVLGEVYGRYEGLSGLGLVLRRVRSTLDDLGGFSERVGYLPIRAAFRGSDADLLKLLIEPLYGNRPEIGLRELIQNAVDAIRELRQYRKDIPAFGEVSQTDQEADVLILIDKSDADEHWVTISDKGIGMTHKIVVEYFLTAGASFRRSEDWRRIFETTEGKSKVLRAGRFGVGALASFLLGPEIHVTTRHVEEEEGMEFRATVESELVELRRVNRPVGTTIRVKISSGLANRLKKPRHAAYYFGEEINWDWYCLSEPLVIRRAFRETLAQTHHLPGPSDRLPRWWRRISHQDYQDIHWTYADAPELTCNGITIKGEARGENFPQAAWTRRFALSIPNVSVFDPDGHLPLNLQRTELAANRYPFDETLAVDVIKDFLAHSLVSGPHNMVDATSNRGRNRYPGITLEAFGAYYQNRLPWFFTTDGFGYVDPAVILTTGSKSVIIINCVKEVVGKLRNLVTTPAIIALRSHSANESENILRKTLEYVSGENGIYWRDYPEDDRMPSEHGLKQERADPDWSGAAEDILRLIKLKGVRILISATHWQHIIKTSRIRGSLTQLLKLEGTNKRSNLLRFGNCPDSSHDLQALSTLKQAADLMAIEVYLDSNEQPPASPIGKEWLRIMRSASIPFSYDDRRARLQHAFDELDDYIDAHISSP